MCGMLVCVAVAVCIVRCIARRAAPGRFLRKSNNRWERTTFTQAVICELSKCVGSVGGELGFTTLEQRRKEARMCFKLSPLHPTCFPSVRLVPSAHALCVCYLTLRYARNSASLFFLPDSKDVLVLDGITKKNNTV